MTEIEWGRQYVREVCEHIWAVEAEQSLLEWQIDGRYVWPLMRMPVYYAITQAAGFFEHPHPAKSVAEKVEPSAAALAAWEYVVEQDRWRRARRQFWLRFRSSPASTVLIPHGRQIEGGDIYTRALASELAGRAMVIYREPTADSPGLDLVTLRRRMTKREGEPPTPEISADDLARLDAALSALESRTGTSLAEIRESFVARVQSFSRQAWLFERFFRFARTKRLYMTDSYYSSAVVAGARAAGVHIVELQHGFISRYHLGYSYPDAASAYLPDEFWTFGEYWNPVLPASVKTRVIGAPYVQELAARATEPRQESRVVFTSQGVLGDRLFSIALDCARKLPEREILYRLHPSEALENYAPLMPLDVPANFTLSHRQPNIFALLGSAGVQVGVFSTTLLEGMALGCRTAVLALPGHEYMLPAVQAGDASFARTAEEVVHAIENAPLPMDASRYYAAPLKKLV